VSPSQKASYERITESGHAKLEKTREVVEVEPQILISIFEPFKLRVDESGDDDVEPDA
jgi:hypothetical protein